MKKVFSFFLMLALLATFGLCQTSGTRFSLKFSGGMGYFSVGELNSLSEGESNYLYVAMDNVSGRFEKMHMGMNFEAEAIYHITDGIGIGIGGGFFRVSRKDKMHYEYYNNTILNDHTLTRTISCVPVTLDIHFMPRLGSRLNLLVSGGVGYYLASLEYLRDIIENRPSQTITATDTINFDTKGTFGLQASLGLEMALTRNLGVFVAAKGWYATVSGLTGEESDKWTENGIPGSLQESNVRFWVYDYEYQGVKYPDYNIKTEKPLPGDVFSNIHELKIDLSGFSLGVGFRINF